MSSAFLYPFNNSLWFEGLHIVIPNNKFINASKSDYYKHKNKLLSSYLSKTQSFVKQNNSMSAFVLVNQSILFYILVFAFIYFIYKKVYKNAFILLIPLCYAATLLLGPIIYFRYTYYLMVIFPIIIMMLANNNMDLSKNFMQQ